MYIFIHRWTGGSIIVFDCHNNSYFLCIYVCTILEHHSYTYDLVTIERYTFNVLYYNVRLDLYYSPLGLAPAPPIAVPVDVLPLCIPRIISFILFSTSFKFSLTLVSCLPRTIIRVFDNSFLSSSSLMTSSFFALTSTEPAFL